MLKSFKKTLSKYAIFSLLLASCFMFMGCPKFEAPKKVYPTAITPPVSESVISIPFQAKVSDIRNALWQELSKINFSKKDGRVEFRNFRASAFDMKLKGNKVNFSVRIKGRVAYRWAKVFGKKFYVKCGLDATANVNATYTLGDKDLQLKINVDKNNSSVKVHKLCNKLFSRIARLFKKTISNLAVNAIDKTLQKQLLKLNLRSKIIDQVKRLSRSNKMNQGFVFNVDPTAIEYTQPKAVNGYFNIAVAARGKIKLTYGSSDDNKINLNKLPIKKKNSIKPVTRIALGFGVPYKYIATKLNSLATSIQKTLLKKKFPTSKYVFKVTDVYPTTSNKVAIAMDINIRNNKTLKKITTIYLTAKLAFKIANKKEYAVLADVDFTGAVNKAIASIISPKLKKQIFSQAKSYKISLQGYRKKLNQLKNYKTDLKLGKKHVLSITAKLLPGSVFKTFLQRTSLGVYARVNGKLSLSYALQRPILTPQDLAPLTQEVPDYFDCIDCEKDYIEDVLIDENDEFISADGELLEFNDDELEQTSTFIKVYPNPTTSVINITSPNTVKEVIVYNTTGAIVGKYTNLTTINVEAFAKGMYFAEVIDTNNNHEVVKFIKK